MDDRSGDATRLLGLAGLAVERVALTPLGIRVVQLVTADPDAARCPDCGQVSTSGKEWVLTRPRDLPVGGGRGVAAMAQAALALPHRDLPAAEFHRADRRGAGPGADHDSAARAVGHGSGGRACQAEVAATFGVSWPTVQRAVVADGQAELGERRGT